MQFEQGRSLSRSSRVCSGSLAAAVMLIGGVRCYPTSGHAIVTACSLILGTISLLHVLKFPVQLRREFACKPLKLVGNEAPESQREAGFRKIPCLFRGVTADQLVEGEN